MMLERYDTLFEEFLINLALTKSQTATINRRLEETSSLFLSEYNGNVEIYSQGSFAMGTTVRPLTANQSKTGIAGEYDIDIVLERTTWNGASDALNSVREILKSKYADKVDTKKHESCERVNFAPEAETEIEFHVDYVPIKYSSNRMAAKRSENLWFESDTKSLVKWFAEYSASETFLPATVLILKRMRDYAGLTKILPSICITALVCELYKNSGSYGDDLMHMISGIINKFDAEFSSLSIKIEPLEDDLARKFTESDHREILTFFQTCEAGLLDAFDGEDITSLQGYLSTSFPSEIDKYPEFLESLRNRNWGIELDGSLAKVGIRESHGRGARITAFRRKFLGAGEKLIFSANEYDKHYFGIRWQVLNSEESSSRRGSLFEARGASGEIGSSSNEFINHETEKYNGEHWIKYYVYSKTTMRVVEIGQKFYVEVEADS